MTENKQPHKKVGFFRRQLNTILACVVVFAVLLTGYLIVRSALDEDEPPATTETPFELLPGEAQQGTGTLIYPMLTQNDIKEVRVHNPSNAARGDQYVDWAIFFAYDEEYKNSYGFFTDYQHVVIDETQLAYFVAAVSTPIFSSRVVDHCADNDLSLYGFSAENEADNKSVEIEMRSGKIYKLYFGKKNPSGTGYYVRSGDTVTLDDGTVYERDSIYLLGTMTTAYFDQTVLTLPTAMVSKLMTYPVSTSEPFVSFSLFSVDESIAISFRSLVGGIDKVQKLFGGSCVYYTEIPDGYFSSGAFETRIRRFEAFEGAEVMEYATKLITGVSEDGEEYSYYSFENETLAKYGLDPDHIQYIMMYTALYEDVQEYVVSEVYFSKLRSDGYYYAYSLNFNTIVRVDPSLVDFLGWTTMDFIDCYALRMSIGYCEELTVKGTIDGKPFEEVFKATVDDEYAVKSAFAQNANKEVSLNYYKEFFRELYTVVLWDEVPSDLDQKALMETEPYFEIRIKTPNLGISDSIVKKLPSATRVLRFYQYSNGRAMMTVEMYDANGTLIEETGQFYVRVSRLDKLLGDAQKLVNGEHFSYYDKE